MMVVDYGDLLNLALVFFVGIFGVATASHTYYLVKFTPNRDFDLLDYVLIACGVTAFLFSFFYLLLYPVLPH